MTRVEDPRTRRLLGLSSRSHVGVRGLGHWKEKLTYLKIRIVFTSDCPVFIFVNQL